MVYVNSEQSNLKQFAFALFKANLVKHSKYVDRISFGCSSTSTFKNTDDIFVFFLFICFLLYLYIFLFKLISIVITYNGSHYSLKHQINNPVNSHPTNIARSRTPPSPNVAFIACLSLPLGEIQ